MINTDRMVEVLARVQRALLILACGATAILVLSLVLGGFTLNVDGSVTDSDAEVRRATEPYRNIDGDVVSQTTRGRAPFRSMRVREAKVVDELSAFVVRGISMRGARSRAYIMDTKQKKVTIKAVGDQLGSYEVVDISEDGVLLRRGNEQILLKG